MLGQSSFQSHTDIQIVHGLIHRCIQWSSSNSLCGIYPCDDPLVHLDDHFPYLECWTGQHQIRETIQSVPPRYRNFGWIRNSLCNISAPRYSLHSLPGHGTELHRCHGSICKSMIKIITFLVLTTTHCNVLGSSPDTSHWARRCRTSAARWLLGGKRDIIASFWER